MNTSTAEAKLKLTRQRNQVRLYLSCVDERITPKSLSTKNLIPNSGGEGIVGKTGGTLGLHQNSSALRQSSGPVKVFPLPPQEDPLWAGNSQALGSSCPPGSGSRWFRVRPHRKRSGSPQEAGHTRLGPSLPAPGGNKDSLSSTLRAAAT